MLLHFPFISDLLNAKFWGLLFSLPPGSWHYSALLILSLNCSPLVSSPYPSPFILFLSLSFSVVFKLLVQILIELKLPGESWIHLQKHWFRLRMGLESWFGLVWLYLWVFKLFPSVQFHGIKYIHREESDDPQVTLMQNRSHFDCLGLLRIHLVLFYIFFLGWVPSLPCL